MVTINDFKELSDQFMISELDEICERKGVDFKDITLEIYESLLVRGANYDDIWQLLKLYLYFNKFVKPFPNNQQRSRIDGEITGLTYRQITGIMEDTHQSRFWHLPSYTGNRKAYNQIVLRRGSEAQWVTAGEFVRQSLIAEDENPMFSIERPSHAFSNGSPSVKYNWIYGRYPMDGDNQGNLRFYFNVRLNKCALTKLIRNIQKTFDLYGIPFKLKFLAEQPEKGRTDPVVLYVERRNPIAVFFLVRDIFRTNRDLLPEVPMFVKKLGDGLGFAEDPINSDSFGMFVCELLTDALIFARGEKNDAKRFDMVKDYICNHRGMEPDQIFRGGARHYNYQFLFDIFPQTTMTVKNRPIFIRPIDEGDFFDEPGAKRTRFLIAALRIAQQICKEALWAAPEAEPNVANQWKCNWITFRSASQKDSTNDNDAPIMEKSRVDQEKFSKRAMYYACTPLEKKQIAYFLKRVRWFYHTDLFQKTIKCAVEDADESTGEEEGTWRKYELNRSWFSLLSPEFKHLANEQTRIETADMVAVGDYLINNYLKTGRPLGNCFVTDNPEENTYFSPTLRHGLAGIGLFFVRLYKSV
ncbi:T3SS effector HopA1 family protein [Dyadobacter luticola]|uniref:Uncharacterized protein n=1 Tax=Dyadobacter luticola TaxID=1979387 RepID=A0A5R9KYZ9_9BACT|nr:T3SS effector HopA1 family protein [Dyadobacter luticola]TLV01320.1 hypothetical protein FEN17_17955 [Dyadobacter luticola]